MQFEQRFRILEPDDQESIHHQLLPSLPELRIDELNAVSTTENTNTVNGSEVREALRYQNE